jgi:hypothetical protein
MAALTLFKSREANAFHELVMEVRTWWAVQLFPRLREEYEVRKQLAEREGRRVQTPEDVALLFSNSTLYAWFCWLERHVQKSKYSSSRWGLLAQIAREPQTAAERLKPGAPLKLDPKLRVPDYYSAHDIHQHPGNLHGDESAGVVYEASALSIHPRTKRNELHERFIELVRREGEFQKVIDMGCGFGKSTIPLAHAFPRAQVTGVDLSQPCLKLAAADARFSNLSNIEFRQADARDTDCKARRSTWSPPPCCSTSCRRSRSTRRSPRPAACSRPAACRSTSTFVPRTRSGSSSCTATASATTSRSSSR